MILFGAAGNSDSFYAGGNKHTVEMPRWMRERGLDAFEYSFGRGINIKAETARLIGAEAEKHNIAMSVHAPYYINFAREGELLEKSYGYILDSIAMLKEFGGKRCIFHPGSQGKETREAALASVLKALERLTEMIAGPMYDGIYLCPETMGKNNQMGTVEEIVEICRIDGRLIPCVDFGHINARERGYLREADDFRRILDCLFSGLGERAKEIHIHFSKIEYGNSGEIRHLTFSDEVFGPDFTMLAPLIKEYNMSPVIICESDGTQAEDAITMKEMYKEIQP